jgi:hypothetical protein
MGAATGVTAVATDARSALNWTRMWTVAPAMPRRSLEAGPPSWATGFLLTAVPLPTSRAG